MKKSFRFLVLVSLFLTSMGLSPASPAWAKETQPAPGLASPTAPSGTIAYVRGFSATRSNGTEIRLVSADGSGDRSLWAVPHPEITSYGITALDWSPGGTELAFASGHEFDCSIYETDLYGIRPDGSGLRRITNSPACAGLAAYPKGTVSVSVANEKSEGVVVFVYIQGAPGVKQVSIGAHQAAEVIFTNVADLGDRVQRAVAIEASKRYIDPIAAVDVQAGQTQSAGQVVVGGTGTDEYGARLPAWRSDGSAIGFDVGCVMKEISAHAVPADYGDLLLGAVDVFGCPFDFGPTPALANQVLYAEAFGGGIYQVQAGENGAGTQVLDLGGNYVDSLQWLPSGSGFLYSEYDSFLSKSNLYRYDFSTKKVTPLTAYDSEFVFAFSISPDGQYVVFEHAASYNSASDLYMMSVDGTVAPHLFMADAARPAWAPAIAVPPVPKAWLYLPAVKG